MKKILLHVMALFFTITVSAQLSITVDPVSISATGPATSTDIGAYTQIINTSADTIELLWSRTVQSMEHEWTTWICDLNNCYLPNIEASPANRPNVLAPGAALTFSVHVGPAGVDGEADIQVQFFTAANPSNILGTLQSHFETGTSSVSDPGNTALRIFPNPTTSYFQLSDQAGIAKVVIYTMVGSKMREYDATQNNRFDVSDLSEGIYLVRLLDAKQTVMKTVRLSKR